MVGCVLLSCRWTNPGVELESKHGMWDGGRDRALGADVSSARLVQSKIWESWAKGCRAQGSAGEIFKVGRTELETWNHSHCSSECLVCLYVLQELINLLYVLASHPPIPYFTRKGN